MKRIIIAGSVAGIATSVVVNGLEVLLKSLGIIPVTTLDYVAVLVLPPGWAGPGYVALVSVLLTQLVASAFFGTLFAYVMDRIGSDLWFLKGLGYGAFLFLVHVSVIPKLWEPRLLSYLITPNVMVTEVLVEISWGILGAYLLTRLLGREGRTIVPT